MKAYLAGPDVFMPDAGAREARRVAICRAHGIEGLSPFTEEVADWRAIFAHDLALMERADLLLVNLTPFRGASADAGTLVELGWFLGRRRPIFAYSNTSRDLEARTRALLAAVPDPLPGLPVEGFGLADNLMVPGAVERGGGGAIITPGEGEEIPFDGLAIFERCVAAAAAAMARP